MSTVKFLTVESAVRASNGLFMSLVEQALAESVSCMSDAEYVDTFHPPFNRQRDELAKAAA